MTSCHGGEGLAIQLGFRFMPLTRPSLLLRLRSSGDPGGWGEFAAIYSQVLHEYARSYGRCEHDQRDIVQNVWLVLCRIMPKFQYQPGRGGFRHLLRKIVKNTAIDWFRRRGPDCNLPESGTMAAPSAEAAAVLDEQRSVLHRALELARHRSSPKSWTCFERHVIERQAARDVGLDLGLSANAVYVSASRVLDRVRTLCIEMEKAEIHE